MADKVKPVPDGMHSVTPYLIVDGAAKAIEFYKKALGAEERFRLPGPGGGVMHAEIQIGDSVIMLSDANPAWGAKSPKAYGGSPTSLMLYVTDVDSAYKKAVDAGAEGMEPPTDMFWGDRMGRISDPFGHQWSIASHIEDVPPDEIEARGKKWAEEMSKQK